MKIFNKYKMSVYINFYIKNKVRHLNQIDKESSIPHYNYVFKHKNIFLRDFIYLYYMILVHSPFSIILYKENIKNIFRFKYNCLLL